MGSQRCAGPLSAAISHWLSAASARTAARAPSISAARAVRRFENCAVPREGFSSSVVAENCASRLSKEPLRRGETSRLLFSARMEVKGALRALRLYEKDVTVCSQFESSEGAAAVALLSNLAASQSETPYGVAAGIWDGWAGRAEPAARAACLLSAVQSYTYGCS